MPDINWTLLGSLLLSIKMLGEEVAMGASNGTSASTVNELLLEKLKQCAKTLWLNFWLKFLVRGQ